MSALPPKADIGGVQFECSLWATSSTGLRVRSCGTLRSFVAVHLLWTIRTCEQFCTDFSFEFEETEWFETPKPSAQVFRFNFKNMLIECPRTAPNTRRAKGAYMRIQYASLKSKPLLQPLDPCPVCGAETTLAEIEPHPLHPNFEIHGYLCDRCGPIKSLVVLRSPPLQPVM